MKLISLLKSGFLAALCSFGLNAATIDNAGVLSEPIKSKLNEMGAELKETTGVTLDLITFSNLNGESIDEAIKPFKSSLKPPYVILVLVPKEAGAKTGKVDIYTSNDANSLFDKEAVLSPYPESGSILPILVSNKGKDIYNAAMLNGYADIADRIANSKGVALKSSIGNSNRDTINIFRYLIYGSIILVIVVFAIRKIKR
ncbi:TPM domain-containing protein [Campylobacter fetus]|uniref:TPM domain-containing protein n=1 Tax=Campylobacter fetus TaxID=196 RepID=UPI000818759F|nr:TPM domain-containing protein [Campylobacter fetus]OCR96482.1 hypothetical protein CFT12S02847_03450 [Campylobacter fetus subsp. testudinum]